MTALRHFPGHVLVFGTESLQQDFDQSSLSAFGEIYTSNSYQLKSGPHYLEHFVVNSGEELRFLDYVRTQPGVISSSLNYIGFGLANKAVKPHRHVELSYPPGMLPKTKTEFFLQLPGEAECRDVSLDKLIRDVNNSGVSSLIAAIDVTPEHCRQVMGMIREGLSHEQTSSANGKLPPIATIGLTSCIDGTSIIDLNGFAGRLLSLAQLVNPFGEEGEGIDAQVLSINLSVDFCQVIQGYNDIDFVSEESPSAVYSIPMIDSVFARSVMDLTNTRRHSGKSGSPAVFAAAGNRLGAGETPRVRLAYPAIRTEVMASSFIEAASPKSKTVEPVDWVDVPATSGLKPCFVINTAKTPISKTNGSSFACAWMAGYFARLAEADSDLSNLGMFSKMARLMQRTASRRLPSGSHLLPCFVSEVGDQASESMPGGDGSADDLIGQMNSKFGADFCLFGSGAAVGEWLRLKGAKLSDLDVAVRKDLGDIDLTYAGRIRDEDIDEVKDFARSWYRKQLGRNWVADHKRRVDLHSYESSSGAGERLRSITPVNKLYISQGGVIDVWGGRDDLKSGLIHIYPLKDASLWASNSLSSTGADSLALNIFQWISIIALLQLVSNSLNVEAPKPDPVSLKEVRKILAKSNSRQDPLPLFGFGNVDLRERLDRRMERVETLMGSCARRQIVDANLDEIAKRLIELRTANLA